MKWYQKSMTVLGVVIGALTAVLSTMQAIEPTIAHLGTDTSIGLIVLGIRRALERAKPSGGGQ